MPTHMTHAEFREYWQWVLEHRHDVSKRGDDILAHFIYADGCATIGVTSNHGTHPYGADDDDGYGKDFSDAEIIDTALTHPAICIALTGDLHDPVWFDSADMEYVMGTRQRGRRTALYAVKEQLLYMKHEMDNIREAMFAAVNRGDGEDVVAELAAEHMYPLPIAALVRSIHRHAPVRSVHAMLKHAPTFSTSNPQQTLSEFAKYRASSLARAFVHLVGVEAFASMRVDDMNKAQRGIVCAALGRE